MITTAAIIKRLKKEGNPEVLEGRKHFGIEGSKGFGLTQPQIKAIAKEIGKNHQLALELWETGYHEARHIATLIADKKQITDQLMDKWMKDFDSWDIVDGCCSNYFRYSPNAYEKAIEWTKRKKEFEKRAGFSLMCYLACHDKKADDKQFEQFFPYIYKESDDERNFVKKAVNWAIRQIGKRNEKLCKKAITLAKEIKAKDDPASRWIASGALRELETYLTEGKIKK
jgi:3-methyladenine DNA glycosylase AlkD